MSEYIPYREIPKYLSIKPGDKIYLSSEILSLSFVSHKHHEEFELDKFIDSFLDAIGSEGTLLIPVFSFSFSDYGIYDYKKNECFTGALGNAALRRSDFKRTKHPMHSFAVWGRDAEKLYAMDNLNSFGEDSPFAYMYKENVKQVSIGADYQKSMTFVHYVETVVGVPYRFIKEFEGIYIDENGVSEKRVYPYYARDLDINPQEQFNRIGRILAKKNISKEIKINDIVCLVIDLAASFDIIKWDIEHNECRNLYSF